MMFDTLCIIPTRECNSNNCSYCNVLKCPGSFSFQEQEKEMLSKLMSHIKTVKFFGGEPLLYPDLCFEIIGYLRDELVFQGDINLNTNLLCLNESILSFLKEHNVTLYYSLDGHIETVQKNRGLDKTQLTKTFQNFRLILQEYSSDLLVNNFVISPDRSNVSYADFLFLFQNSVKQFNLLPAMYVGWTKRQLKMLDKALQKICFFAQSHPDINIENTSILSPTPLFNNYLVWDTDSKIYSTMFVLEKSCKDKEQFEVDPLHCSLQNYSTMQTKLDTMLSDILPLDIRESTKAVNNLLNTHIEILIQNLSNKKKEHAVSTITTFTG